MSISKVNIQEANSHLRQLHKKVFELENRIQMQALHVEELQKTNLQLQKQLKKLTNESTQQLREKESVISELSQRLEESDNHVQQLLEAAHERDTTLVKLESKARLFYEVAEHRSSLSRIVEVLDELSIEEEMKEGGSGSLEVVSEPVGTATGRGEGVGGEGASGGDRSVIADRKADERLSDDDTGPEMKLLSA